MDEIAKRVARSAIAHGDEHAITGEPMERAQSARLFLLRHRQREQVSTRAVELRNVHVGKRGVRRE